MKGSLFCITTYATALIAHYTERIPLSEGEGGVGKEIQTSELTSEIKGTGGEGGGQAWQVMKYKTSPVHTQGKQLKIKRLQYVS